MSHSEQLSFFAKGPLWRPAVRQSPDDEHPNSELPTLVEVQDDDLYEDVQSKHMDVDGKGTYLDGEEDLAFSGIISVRLVPTSHLYLMSKVSLAFSKMPKALQQCQTLML